MNKFKIGDLVKIVNYLSVLDGKLAYVKEIDSTVLETDWITISFLKPLTSSEVTALKWGHRYDGTESEWSVWHFELALVNGLERVVQNVED